jgi:hypothetical protein
MVARLTELYEAWPHDLTLRNLAGLLDRALESSTRLRLFAHEAAREGLVDCVAAYERLDRIQREQIVELEQTLRSQLSASIADARRRQVVGVEQDK